MSKPTLTPEEQQMAKAFGMTAEEYAAHKSPSLGQARELTEADAARAFGMTVTEYRACGTDAGARAVIEKEPESTNGAAG